MYTLQSMVTTTSTCMLGVGVIRVFSTFLAKKKIESNLPNDPSSQFRSSDCIHASPLSQALMTLL